MDQNHSYLPHDKSCLHSSRFAPGVKTLDKLELPARLFVVSGNSQRLPQAGDLFRWFSQENQLNLCLYFDDDDSDAGQYHLIEWLNIKEKKVYKSRTHISTIYDSYLPLDFPGKL